MKYSRVLTFSLFAILCGAALSQEATGGNEPLSLTGAADKAFEDLKASRKDVGGNVVSGAEAALKASEAAVKAGGANFSKHLEQAEDLTADAATTVASLKAKRAEVTRLREEARKQELAKLGADNKTVVSHQVRAASEGAATVAATAGPKVIYKGPPTDMLEKLINATNMQVAQDAAYQKAQLALQKKRMESMGIKTEDDAETEETPDGRKVEQGKMDHLLLAPGRAQARTHCGSNVLRTAGYRWCKKKQVCLDTHTDTCPGDEWSKPMKAEVELLTKQLGELRRRQLMKDLGALRSQLNMVKKVMGVKLAEEPKAPRVRPAGMGEFGRLKGHAYSLRRQIKRLAKQMKEPVPEDPFEAKNLPVPINDGGTPGSQQGQAGAIMKKLTSLVNQIAVSKNRIIIAALNREVDVLMANLRTMTIGAHCLSCGKGHCHVNARDAAQLWPKPRRCGCNDLAHPGCPCPTNCGDKFKPKKPKLPPCGCKDKGGTPHCPCTRRPVLCGDPGTPRHAVRMGNTYSENSTLHFLCQPPFVLKGSEFRTCTSKPDKWKTGDGAGGWKGRGTWDGTQPECVPPSCGKPDDLEHGDWVGMKFEFPHRIEAHCHRTFSLDGPKVLQCMANGKWDTAPETILCIPLQEPSETIKDALNDAQKADASAGSGIVEESLKDRLDPGAEPIVNSVETKLKKSREMGKSATRGVTIDELLMVGATKIAIDKPEAKGFRVGQTVDIGADTEDSEHAVIKDMEGNLILESALKKDHDAGEIVRVIHVNATADPKRAVSDAIKGANDAKLDSAADFLARNNRDVEAGSLKDMERSVLDSARSLEYSRAARDEAAAMVLANSPHDGIPQGLRDPLMKTTEGGDPKQKDRDELARAALNVSPLSRPQAVLESDQKHAMAGRAGQAAGLAAGTQFAKKVVAERGMAADDSAEMIARCSAVSKTAGFAAGVKQDDENEGARVGRNAAIAKVAEMLATVLQLPASEILKAENTEVKAIAKETKSGEQLAAEAEKREELATVAAEKKEAIERELEQKKQDAEDKIEQEAEEKKGMNPEELKAAEAMEKKKEAAVKKLEDDAKAKEAVVDSGIGLNTETGASGPAVASE